MNPDAIAHGMDGTLVPPDWPPLTLAELRAFSANSQISVSRFASSPSARVHSPRQASWPRKDTRVFIKRHHRALRDREGLLEEHRFLAHLLSHGASVPRVLASATGETAIQIGDSTYEVHEIPAGIDLYEDAISWTPFRHAAHAHSAGQALARLHLAAQDFTAPPRQRARSSPASPSSPHKIPPQRFTATSPPARRSRITNPFAPAPSRPSSSSPRFTPSLRRSCPRSPRSGHTMISTPRIFSGPMPTPSARATAIIDFGLADRTNAVHDLAHAIERNIVEWLVLVNDPGRPGDVPIHFDHLNALLDGYESVRPLTARRVRGPRADGRALPRRVRTL